MTVLRRSSHISTPSEGPSLQAKAGTGLHPVYLNALTEAEDFQELIDLQAQNKTVREIAAETGFAPTHRPPQD